MPCLPRWFRDNIQPRTSMDDLTPPRSYRARQADLLLRQFQKRVIAAPSRNSASTPSGTQNSERKLEVLDRVVIPCWTPRESQKIRYVDVENPARYSSLVQESSERMSPRMRKESSPVAVADPNASQADQLPDSPKNHRPAIFRGWSQRNSFRVDESDDDNEEEDNDDSAGHESGHKATDRPQRAAAIKARQTIYENRHSEAGRSFRLTLSNKMYEGDTSMNQVQRQNAPARAPASQPTITPRPRAPSAVGRRQSAPASATRGRKRRRESSPDDENQSPVPKREPSLPDKSDAVVPSTEFDVETFLGRVPRMQTGGMFIREEPVPQATIIQRAVAAQLQAVIRERAGSPASRHRQEQQTPRHTRENTAEAGTEVTGRTRPLEDGTVQGDDRAVRNALDTNLQIIEDLERRLMQARRDARDMYMREVHAIRAELVYNYRLYLDQL